MASDHDAPKRYETYLPPSAPTPPLYITAQTKSPQRVALERGGWLALGVAVAIALLEGLSHTLAALNVGFALDPSVRSGILVSIPLIVVALRAYEGRHDQRQAEREP